MGTTRSERNRKKTSKWKWSILVIILILFAVSYPIYRAYHSISDTLNGRESAMRDKNANLKRKEPFSILLLGVDERNSDRGRTDTMMVLTINPAKGTTKLVSIPRDTRTEIVGQGKLDKINHAYAYGGVQMSMNTVEKLLQIPVDFYIKVNMEGFKEIVDAVGGVTVVNRFSFSYEGHHFPAGKIKLTGAEALAYTRMRKLDPSGDAGRQERQRQVILQIIEKGVSLNSLSNINELAGALLNHVRTNLTIGDILQIQKKYKNAANRIESVKINGYAQKINGIYYEVISNSELTRIQTILQNHLGFKRKNQ